MFTSLKTVLPSKIKNLGIKNQVDVIDNCRKIEIIINKKINSDFKIKISAYKDKSIFIKTENFQLANEVKLMEQVIKKELKKNNIEIKNIKYIIQ